MDMTNDAEKSHGNLVKNFICNPIPNAWNKALWKEYKFREKIV